MSVTAPRRFSSAPLPRPLLLITFFVSLPLGTMDFLLPLYGRSVAASELQIGGLFSVAALLGLVLRPLAGTLADRGWAARLLVAGVACYVVAMLGYSAAQSYPALLLSRIAQSLGGVAVFMAIYVLLAARSPEAERGSVFGRLTGVTFAAFLAGGVLAGLILILDAATQQEVRAALDQLGLAAPLPAPLPRLQALHLLYGVYAAGALLALPAALALLRAPGAAPGPAMGLRHGLGTLLRARDPAVLRLLLAGLLLGLGYNLATPMLLLLLQDRFGDGLASLAVAYAIPGLLYVVLPGPLGRRADGWGLARSATAGMLTRSLVYLLLPFSPSLALVALLWTLEATGYSLSSPALQGLLSRMTAPELRGSLYGLYSLSAGIGSMAGGLGGGWLYQNVAQAAPFWGQALLLIAAGLLIPANKARGTPERTPGI